MEKMPQEHDSILNETEKEIIVHASIESAENLEDVVANVNRATEEAIHEKNDKATKERIDELQKSLKEERVIESEAKQGIELSVEDREDIMHGLEQFDAAERKYNYDPLTMIKAGDGLTEREYFHTDEKSSKASWFSFSGNKRGHTLEALGSLAEKLGIDLTEGKTIKEIKEVIKERLG
jgi:hypothetical protein